MGLFEKLSLTANGGKPETPEFYGKDDRAASQ
jgi:hypothetical protein